jgi:uncharacterized membrane protein
MSPWRTSAPAVVAPHWRAAPAMEERVYVRELESESLRIYCAGALGTALSGGLFPLAIVVVGFGFALLSGRGGTSGDLAGFAMSVVFGFLVGFLIFGAVALFIFPFVALLQWMAGLQRWRGILVSCAGGWCGFASVAATGPGGPHGPPMLFAFGAMIMGQIGAGWAVRRVARPANWLRAADEPTTKVQMPLRQLFGITTAVAVAVAVLSALPLTSHTHAAMALAAALQGAIVTGYLLIRRLRQSAPTESPRLAAPDDVPRATIARIPSIERFT